MENSTFHEERIDPEHVDNLRPPLGGHMGIKPRLHSGLTEQERYRDQPHILNARQQERERLAPMLEELGIDDDPALGLNHDVFTASQMNDLVLRVIRLERKCG